jgi:anti-anti-sigma factor
MDFHEVLEAYNERHPTVPVAIRREEPGLLELAILGELDMEASSGLKPLLEAAVYHCPERGRLVLNFSHVAYIASMGVGLVSALMVLAGKRSVSLILLDIPPQVRKIMETLGLLSFFNEERSSDK